MSRHERVYSYIQNQVLQGDLLPGSKLMGERKLAEELQVSRETVRQGLKLAEEAGIIVRIPALGTFVSPPQVHQELGEMTSFSSTIRQLSLEPSYESIAISHVTLSATQAEKLQVSEQDPALRITAIGVANDHPLAYYESLLPERVFSQLPEHPPWNTESTYQIAARALNVSDVVANQEFESIGMPHTCAQTLKVAPGSPSFRSITLFSSGSIPIELRTALYPGGSYKFKISRHVQL